MLASPVFSQKKSDKTPPPVATAASSPAFDAEQFKGLKWRNIGPFRGGRSNAVSGVVQNENVYYAGYTGGGVWKTEDAGLIWRNISDGFFKTGSVGDIAVAESDPNVLYVGMGEHAVRGVMSSFGDGVYKSTDAGKTWQHLGLEQTRHISDVVIHPQNPDLVYVAAQGPNHGPGSERGVFKSSDGGKTWRKVLFVDENTGASSLVMDMTNPRILYAATWQHRRFPWKVESGPNSAVWKSTDGGETWNKIMEGLPKEMGKIGLSTCRSDPNRVYAIVEAEKSKAGVYRSEDGGKKWSMMTNDQTLTARSWYYMEIFADPQNAEIVYVLNAPMMRSIDGGKTFSRVRVGHGDTHDLWLNPNNGSNMVLGDDGGAEITFNRGSTWSSLMNQPTAQFYRVNVDHLFPYNVYGGQQDNSSVRIASRTNGFGIGLQDWAASAGCECGHLAFDPKNPVLVYGGCYQGQVDVLDTRTNEAKDIMQYPAINLSAQPKDMKFRFNWNAPLLASPHDPRTIYHAANVLFKTTDGGLNWQVVSPDLTRNDTTKQELGGGPITNEGAGGENYNTIYYVIESPAEQGVIYTGSDCGIVHVTRNGGANWTNITPPNLPESMIHSIEVSPHANGTAYISATRYKFNDFSALVFKTTDYGKTWTEINTGIDKDDFLRVIREDKKVPGLLYGGSERGFYVSFNGGTRWEKLQLNLPVVPVTDMILHNNDLVVSTAGRSFWILDDVSAIQQSKGQFGDVLAKLYQPNTAIRIGGGGTVMMPEPPPGIGLNPPTGAILDYFLKEKADTNLLKLEILASDGKLLRSFTNKKDENLKTWPGGPTAPTVIPAEAGINRFAWDMRGENLEGVQGVYVYGDYRGHVVAPGRYKARLIYKEQTSETDFEIVADPRLKAMASHWQEQQDLMSHIEGHIADIHGSVNKLRRVKKQVEGYNELLKDKELQDAGKALNKKIDAWEENVVDTKSKNFQDVINFQSKINAEFFDLRSRVDVHDPRVTQGVRDRLRDLEAEWARHKQAMQQILDSDVAAYNQLFKGKNLPALMIGEK